MNKTACGILILSTSIFLTMLMDAGAATVEQDLSVTVVPSSSKQPGQCVYGNHGPVRGRPTVVSGRTIIADDGCELFGIASFTIPDGPFAPCYTSLAWWKQIHDQGHINVIRAFGYLGNWYDGGSNYTDLPTQEANLDTMVSLASQAGMYMIIDYHPGPTSGHDWSVDKTYWSAIAPRYANNTNVIYEEHNEPDQNYANGFSGEDSTWQLIRSLAPNTPIIAWSFAYPTQLGDIVSFVRSNGPHIDYSNTAVGWHSYGAGYSDYDSLNAQLQAAGYSTIMTESENKSSSDLDYMIDLYGNRNTDPIALSTGLQFADGSSNVCPSGGNTVNVGAITWPAD